MLRYFRVLEDSETASSTRYLMTDVLVGELAARSVRYLATDMSPLRLPPGLREFQQRLGFRLARVRVRTAASRPSDIGRSESAIQGPSSEF